MKQWARLALGLGLGMLLWSGCTHTSPKTEDERFLKFVDRVFDETVLRYPEYQTYMGIKKDYGKLNELGEAVQEREYKLAQKHLKDLNRFDPNHLSVTHRVSYDLFKKNLIQQIEYYEFRFHDYPVNQMFGQHSHLPAFMINMHLVKDKKDAQAYISRLREFKPKFDQLIRGLQKRENLGVIPPKFVFAKAIEDSQNVITGKPFDNREASSPMWEDFNAKLDTLKLKDGDRKRLLAQAESALKESVKPAYEKLIDFLKEQETRADERAGVWKLPHGERYYQMLLHHTTTTHLTADAIHELGLQEVAKIHGEMRKLMKRLDYKGNLQSFFRRMQSDKKFYFPDTPDGRKAYLARVDEVIDQMRSRLPELFTRIPKAELVVKPVEAFREKSAGTAFYDGPAPDGSRPGIYYVNLSDMSKLPRYELEALAYHETIPGHHLQIALANEQESLPKFRRYGGDTAYVEGWGLYAEQIPKEIGMYKDPYSDFGRLSYKLWRAARLVTDTGIHQKRWTREQAIDYLKANTPASESEIVGSVERYIVMPAQATAYMIGMLKFAELREKAHERLGKSFNLKEYHDEVLRHGSVPLDILEKLIEEWIEKKVANSEQTKPAQSKADVQSTAPAAETGTSSFAQ